MIIINYEKQSSFKTDLEKGITITSKYLEQYQLELEEKLKQEKSNASSAKLGKRKVQFFQESPGKLIVKGQPLINF